MKLIKKLSISLLILLAAGGATVVYADTTDEPPPYTATVTASSEHNGLAEGTRVDLTLPDQFGVSHTVGPEVTTLILASSKRTGKQVRGYLDAQDADFLSAHKAVFVADISSIPAMFRDTIALPMLRKSTYPVLLIYAAELAKKLRNDEQDGKIVVATLANNVVQSVQYVANKKALARVFE